MTDGFLVETLDHADLFHRFSATKARKKSFYKFPYIKWPNNHPCHIANLYLLHLARKHQQISADGRRQDSKGGTIGQYASNISLLIKRCWQHGIDPYHITDRFYENFIIELIEEPHPTRPGKPKRKDGTTINIGRECLKFLAWIGDFHGDPNFVSRKGTIKLTTEEVIRTFNNQNVVINTTSHHAHPLPFREHTRGPIPLHNIDSMELAINSGSGSDFLKARHLALITLLQHTGARRAEIASLTLSSLRDALLMKYPMLRLVTLKRGDAFIREVPVNAIALNEVKKYIHERQKIIKKHPENNNDYLFISQTTGRPLAVESFTSTISLIRKAAGIEEQACAHMFRHAFITNLFTLLIERHKFESKDDFEAALISDREFLRKVREWTGHKSIESLRDYLTKVFEGNDGIGDATESVHKTTTLELYQKKYDALYKEFKLKKITQDEFVRKSDELMELRDRELSRYDAKPK
ncbi:tyrosine-type recombinase/integrase [Pseudomonas asturiensis]|uniref:Tyrosine-type recombinase/integrase n=1 Tax=Pseudomonas asturiensis TaxID=1190415 RepID=A0ABX6HIC4_9PSED|nr:tyrosine-type recombinase/integrase [Pseudomonas asturiensis]QHF05089.1 tyrosine-type recombinase/integrase [Pseudomonas asturiensis]